MTCGTADGTLLTVLVMFKKMYHLVAQIVHLVFWQNKYGYQTGASLILKYLLCKFNTPDVWFLDIQAPSSLVNLSTTLTTPPTSTP